MTERQPPHGTATAAAEDAAYPAAFVSRGNISRQRSPLAAHTPPHARRQPLPMR